MLTAQLRITLPWPDAKLNPNRSKGMHWAGTAALRKKAREDAWRISSRALAFKTALSTGFQPLGTHALSITFVQPDKRARDRDNLLAALKPSLDGMADALGINDSQFDPITIRREYGSKPGAVIVEIT